MDDGKIKIAFHTPQDEDGYPPQTVETLWARAVGEDEYELLNIPFFARSVSLQDVVAVKRENDEWWFARLLRESGHTTVRVVVFEPANVPPLRRQLKAMGCASEGSHLKRLFSLDVPPDVPYEPIRRFLIAGADRQEWTIEESAISTHHRKGLSS
jgi:Domain of unknown function (DUF4265)